MNLPQGYQLEGASNGPTTGVNVPHGYVLDPTGYVPQSGGGTTALGAAGRGAVGMLPLGEQAYSAIAGAAENKPYLQERQELAQEIEADKANHPVARVAGQAAGVVAPALLTGGSSIPESLLGAAGQGAAIGAGFGAGNAIDTLAGGGSGAQAAGDVALGAGLGAAGGAIGRGLGSVVGKTASAALPSQDELAAEATAGVLGGTARQIRALPGKNPVDTLNTMRGVMNTSTVNGEPLIKVGQRMPERLQNVIDWQKQQGGVIGDTIKNANVAPMELQPIVDKISQSGKFLSPDDAAHLSSVAEDIKKYAVDGKMPFDRLQQAKTDIGDQAFGGKGNPVLQNVYHELSDAQDAELEKASTVINKPEFDSAKLQYQTASRALPLLKMAVARELGGKVNVLAPGAALLTGHPLVAAAALAKNRLGQIASGGMFKAVGAIPSGIGETAAAIPSVAGAQVASGPLRQNMGETKPLRTGGPTQSPAPSPTDIASLLNHPALAQYRPGFEKNAAAAKNQGEIQKSMAKTDFINSQTMPAYAAAKQEAADSPLPEASQNPAKMADGGMVASDSKIDEPIPAMGSTLQGFADQLKHPTHEAMPPKPEAVPMKSEPKFHEPFNPDFAEQLKAFLNGKKGRDDAQSR